MTTWIEDDTDIIDAIESAKETWLAEHSELSLPPTDETTDEDINEALGLPRSGAIRDLSTEFADWSKEEISRAVKAGLDNWSNRAEVRYETLTNYSSVPPAGTFHQADLSELEEISRNIDESEESSLQTEHSKSAWDVDRRYCTKAIELARSGKTVFVAEDEDGYYFATTGD